ncbi:galactokinase [Kosmotoga arenicorallina S304]|uniref:Galactokinase n=1 Tax=Kosmotoga arenicorallina S304 TaxID=1453497 RepID=A0A176K0S4_9BACT|nr:galactokinase [Kosmotoga arenicorallina]MDK2954496.1 galactokinase [Kosmotoga sp.]OAA30428.1 galactokinase [Kosmotoga arenicorallina S304]
MEYYVAPGRLNIIGEHTDYNGGFVLPVAIDRYVQVGIEKSEDGLVHVESENFGKFDFNPEDFSPTDSWKDYIIGIFHVLKAEKVIKFPGLKLEIKSNVPEGAGLSSSAALEVAVITALNGFLNLGLTDKDRYLLAQKAENEFVGVKCGIMDQFASVMGKKDHAIFLDTVSMEYEYVPLKTQEYTLVVIDSGVKHSLSDGGYNKRREEAQKALEEFGVSSYRELSLSQLFIKRSQVSEISYKRAMHVITENERVKEAVDILKHSNFENLGRVLNQSHESLAIEYEVSCDEINFIVDTLKEIDGVTGCRMIGGGFGGSVLAICEKAKVGEISKEVKEKYSAAYGKEAKVYIVNSSDGARKDKVL